MRLAIRASIAVLSVIIGVALGLILGVVVPIVIVASAGYHTSRCVLHWVQYERHGVARCDRCHSIVDLELMTYHECGVLRLSLCPCCCVENSVAVREG